MAFRIPKGKLSQFFVVPYSMLAAKDLAAGRAKLAPIVLQARHDLVRDWYEILAKAIHVGLASSLLVLRPGSAIAYAAVKQNAAVTAIRAVFRMIKSPPD